jgi:hypothetical protein
MKRFDSKLKSKSELELELELELGFKEISDNDDFDIHSDDFIVHADPNMDDSLKINCLKWLESIYTFIKSIDCSSYFTEHNYEDY